jgi:hypothetical protein
MSEYRLRHKKPPDPNPERNKGGKFSTEPTGKTAGPAGVHATQNEPKAQNLTKKSSPILVG